MRRYTYAILLLACCAVWSAALTACDWNPLGIPRKIRTESELGPETLARIDAVNAILDAGLEIGPETRALIRELNQTIKEGVKVEGGFDEATLQRVDELLRVIEDKTIEIGPETLQRVDELLNVIDNAPDQWEDTATAIVRTLESSAGTAAAQMAREVEQVVDHTQASAAELVELVGVGFRCNVDFMGARAESTIDQFVGRTILGRLRAIVTGQSPETTVPIPWVCHIQPDRLKLSRVGDQIVYREGVITITGFDYVDANLPQARVVDEQGTPIDAIHLFPFRTSPYQLEVNLQQIDLSAVPDRSRIEFRWSNVPDRMAVALVMPDPHEVDADFRAEVRRGPAPLTVPFTDLSRENPTKWRWEFGDGETSTARNPTFTYEVPGRYTVKLTASNAHGSDQEVKPSYIVVQEPPIGPTARFEAEPRRGQVPLTVEFTDRSEENPTSWQWAFGDGGTSNQQNPTHQYTQPGRYKVTLTVANEHGSDTKVENAYVDVDPPGPVAAFEADTRRAQAPLTVQFTDRSTGAPTSWQWAFGDGGTSTQQNPEHVYRSPGQYTVELTVSNAFGSDTETKSKHIRVDPRPLFTRDAVYFHVFANLGDNVRADTDIPTTRYTCGIVGMAALDGDIQEDDDGDILLAYMYEQGNTWRIRADFRTHKDDENWWIDVMCIDKERGSGFLLKRYAISDTDEPEPTGFLEADYTCGIVGMLARDGDIYEDGDGDILRAYTFPQGGEWYIQADFRSHKDHEEWEVDVLCIQNEPPGLYVRPPWLYKSFSGVEGRDGYNTGISSRDYICGLVGMAALNGDIQENDDGDIIRAFTFARNGQWWVQADFRSHRDHENWDVNVLCASREIAWSGATR